jgi:dynactin 1
MASTEPFLGALVEVSLGRGVVRFYGPTSFSSGKWVGIELNEPKGKNDGSVMGVSYFTCKPNHGVFIKPSQVRVLGPEAPSLAPPSNVRSLRDMFFGVVT